MAVAVDLIGSQVASATTTVSVSHTCSGTGCYAVAFVDDTSCVGGISTVTSVTYGGVPMTRVRADVAQSATQVASAFGLFSPPIGSQTVLLNRTGSGGNNVYLQVSSFNGADQTAGVSASGATPAVGGSGTVSLTTTVDNSGVFAYIQNTSATPTVTAGSTNLYTLGGMLVARTTVFPSTPIGVKTIGWTAGGGSTTAIILALAPFGTTTMTPSTNKTALYGDLL